MVLICGYFLEAESGFPPTIRSKSMSGKGFRLLGVAPPALRLGLHHVAHLRAVAEGIAVVEAAKRYLGVDRAAEALAEHRSAVDRVAAVARRRGDSRWRLLGIELREPQEAAEPLPTLGEWAEGEGLEDLAEAELLELYAERFPPADAGTGRRQARNARLRAKRLALLRELEAVAAERPAPQDLLDGWLPVALAEQLRRGGALTLGDVQRRIARGGRWWRGLPAWGPVKAARLARHVELLLGPPPALSWPVALSGLQAGALTGQQGANRARAGAAGIDADDDRAAIRAWIAARAGSALTARQYEREAERFLLWCVLERGRALADATAEDCRGYMDFIAEVPERWISRRKVERFAAGWAPFKGPLSLASQGVAIAALHSLFSWLVQARYLAANPWVLVNRKLGDDAAHGGEDATSRAFTPGAWKALHAQLQAAAPSASVARLRWLLVFVECTGLRAAELLGARRSHLQRSGQGWVLRVHGKGRKNRTVPVPAVGMEATRTYFAARGLDLETAPPEAPLLGSLADAMAPVGYSTLHETFTRFVRRAVKASDLPPEEKQRAAQASTHWLRHTHATRAAERNVPPDVLQENLGQSDPRTTARYYRAQMQRRQKEMEQAFAQPSSKE
jgi:integrase